jgi:uncharacterized protein (DUF1684 family)
MLEGIILAAAMLAADASASPAAATDSYRAQIQEWRRQRVARLTAPSGWLSLVGLDWLEDGSNTLGSAPGNSIVLENWPAHLGTIVLEHGKASIALAAGVDATIDGKPGTHATLLDDSNPKPTVIASGSKMFYLIQRGDRHGLRVKDSEAPARRNFLGFDYFEVDPGWRIEAKWEAYDPPHEVEEPNVLGQIDKVVVPGAAVFERDGKTFRVEPVIETPGDTELFLVFADRTSGKETYGAARFVYTEAPKDGKVVIDFNKAYNPPCAFTPYATCPLPTRQNRLDLRITAGEKKYRGAID